MRVNCGRNWQRPERPSLIPKRLNAWRRNSGYRDWNTASARLSNMPEVVLQVGDQVSGRYLKQGFDGRVLAVREMAGGSAFEVTLEFDEPVDVVEFESFSAFRKRVTATISSAGVSFTKTSDGVPHLVVERTSAGLV